MSLSRHLAATSILALLAGASLVSGSPVQAQDDLWFMMDTGAPEAPPNLWPDRVVVDAKSWMLLAVWNTDPPQEQKLPMAQVVKIERHRPWEGQPDELIAELRDGRHVLLARGSSVSTAATLLTAVVGRPVVSAEPGADRPELSREDGKAPDTTMALGSVHSGAAVATLIEEDQDRRKQEGASQAASRTVIAIDERLPANADPNALSPALIKATVQSQMARIRGCYQREFQRNPSLKGKIVVRFIIEEDGSVSGARLRETSMNNTVVEQCIIDEVAGMRFDKPQAGKVVPVSFPFNFTGG